MQLDNYILQCLVIENPINGYENNRDMHDLQNLYEDTSVRISVMISEDFVPPGKALYDSLSSEFGPENINKTRMDAVYNRIYQLRAYPKEDAVRELSK